LFWTALALSNLVVAQVKFTEWTRDDQLSQPVFLGLRSDKQAKDVVRE
jgi:bifunctional non-homologous end joining protein LigD